ncbi:ABC transporter substrate-binding protein [Nonomuraea muscovyensis]|uniref:Multiple sugar transport system substrate-binding protein n=1 Tax=Nonomuraea muscovyensis TaxID=1124761 RepID=A0A7X0CBA0_9ACTN|nr:ABC transporter substrate-binding protein [Nonomuraea muscovyensis]MBB6351667.1 multiple sugar transport system substrate-binding protein [Nonomuraea muscovyensis]MDF2705128.1 extracellular solute-binding protein family 1 [Nonomuraea muscovyensis]
MRISTVTAAVAATVLLAAGCGGGTQEQADGPVEIVMWHGQEDTSAKSIEKLVGRFNETHPGIRVKTTSGGVTADGMLPKITAALTSDAHPDIAYLYGSWAPNIARNPKTADLTEHVKDPAIRWDDFWASEREAVTVDGKVIGFPAVVDNMVVLYNEKLLAKAGLKPPGPDWTWDDFRAMAKRATDAEAGVFGTTWAISGGEEAVWGLWPMVWQAGGDILTPDRKKAAFHGDAGQRALGLLRGMAVEDKSVYLDSSPAEKGQKLFESSRLAFFLSGPWVLPDLQAAGLEYGVVPLPGTNGNHETISGPDNWVVFEHDERRVKASATFLAWLTAAEQQLQWMTDTGSLPIRASISELPGYQDYLKKYPGIDVISANLANAKRVRPPTTKYPRVSSFVADAIARTLLGKADAKAALAEAAAKTDAALAVPGS